MATTMEAGAPTPRLDDARRGARGGAGGRVWLPLHAVGADLGGRGRSGRADRPGGAFGFWLIAGVLASYITRRPGAALVGEFLAALAEVLFGAAAGTPLLVTGDHAGPGRRDRVWRARWSDYSLTTMMLAGAVAMLVALPWNWFRLGYFQLNPGCWSCC